jgi:hypothetical protein
MPQPITARLCRRLLRRLSAAACVAWCTAAPAVEPAPEVEDRPPPPQLDVEHPQDSEDKRQEPAPTDRVYRSDVEQQTRIGEPVKTVVVNKQLSEERAGALCAQLQPRGEPTLDRTRRVLEQIACTTALWLDGMFGDLYHVDSARAAYGRIESSYFYSGYYGHRTRLRVDMRADFPNISRRLTGFFGRDDDEAFVRDRSERFALRSQFPEIEDQDEWLAGLGYSLPGNQSFRSDFRIGLRGLRHPRLFVQNRVGYIAFADNNDLLYLRTTPFWNTEDGFGITSGVDVSHVINDTRLLRWANVATLSQDTEGLDWRSSVIHYQALQERRGIAYEAFIRGATGAAVDAEEYGTRVVFRHPMFGRRLYGQWVAGYTWPKTERGESREGTYGAGLGLELPFGEKYD